MDTTAYYTVYMTSCDGRAIEFECVADNARDAENQALMQYEDARINDCVCIEMDYFDYGR